MNFNNGGHVQDPVLDQYMQTNTQLNIGAMRPYIDHDGTPCMAVYKGGDPNKPENYMVKPVNNATLRRDEWKTLDESVKRVARERLTGVQDLIDNGLVFDLNNAMGTTVLEYHDVDDSLEAEMSMDGISRSNNDRPNFGTNYLPIPIIHVDYQLNLRALSASRNMGNPLDTTLAENAARRVLEKRESLLFTDTKYNFSGGTIYSYLNHPDRNQVTLSANWDELSATSTQSIGEQIVDDVISMKQSLIAKNQFGPYVVYIPQNYETVMDKDYDTTRGNTIRSRIEALENVQKVKVVDKLPDDNVLMVQMTSETVRLVRGLDIQNVEWKSEGNFVTNYKVMAIQVPQIRSDQNGNCGVAHLA